MGGLVNTVYMLFFNSILSIILMLVYLLSAKMIYTK